MEYEREEAAEAVSRINDELYAKYGEEGRDLSYMPALSITFGNSEVSISLHIPSDYGEIPSLLLYNSENNDREYYENFDTEERLYKLIKRKFREVKKIINDLEL